MGNLEAWTHLIGFESILLIRAKISSKVKSVFVFKAYDWPEIVNRLDDEEKAYISWEEQEAQLKILMNSKSERPVWPYPEPKRQSFCQSIRKVVIKAGKRAEWPKFDQLL